MPCCNEKLEWLDNLKNIKNETLIIWGDQDKAYNFNQVETLKIIFLIVI